MTNDLLTIAKSREEQLTLALTESVAGMTSISIDKASSVASMVASHYSAKASGLDSEYIILASKEDLAALGNGEANGPAAVLQRLAVSITTAINEGAVSTSGAIKISSPGEIEIKKADERDWTAIAVVVADRTHMIYIALQPVGDPGATANTGTQSLPLPEFGHASKAQPNTAGSLGLLADVEVDVTVELGRRRLPINELLTLTRGSIIELSKLVGEPLEVYVNNRLIADGEAVVIDEQFGIRITNIVPTAQRSIAS